MKEQHDHHDPDTHSALNGMTPLQAWLADPRPVEKAEKDTIVAGMQKRDDRALNSYGIEIRNAIGVLLYSAKKSPSRRSRVSNVNKEAGLIGVLSARRL